MNYPPWSQSEYDCVTDNLQGVLMMVQRIQREAEIRKLESEMDSIKSQSIRGIDLRKAIEDAFLEIKRSSPKDERTRIDVMRDAVEYYRKSLAKIDRYGEAGYPERDAAFIDLWRIYSAFDIDTFQEDFGIAFKDEIAEPKVSARLRSIDKEVTQLKGLNNKEWSARVVNSYFRNNNIPKAFRDWRIPSVTNAQMAERVFRSFVADFRSRQTMFETPVNIYGVAIDTMPEEYRTVWVNLYTALECNRLTRRVLYMPLVSDLVSTKTETAPVSGPWAGRHAKQSA